MREIVPTRNHLEPVNVYSNGYDQRQQQQQQRQPRQEASSTAAERKPQETNSKRWTCGRLCFLLGFPVVVLGVVVVVLYVTLGGLPFLPKGSIPVLDDLVDPFEGVDPNEAPKWDHASNGNLRLVVLNALDPKWDSQFARAVQEWDNGSPDVLTLTTRRVRVDPDCDAVAGRLKVCNGDYGETDWYGINALLLTNGGRTIRASTARLNDGLLDRSSAERKQYTMCHEIGHGFGLPHTDENFFNGNLGNCMDYTNNPRSNQSPDASNFNFLQQMYGTNSVASAAAATQPTGSSSAMTTTTTMPSNGGLRKRSRVLQSEATLPMDNNDDMDDPVPQQVLDRCSEAISTVQSNSDNEDPESIAPAGLSSLDDKNVVLLEENQDPTSRSYRFDLGEGYMLEVHMLLQSPP